MNFLDGYPFLKPIAFALLIAVFVFAAGRAPRESRPMFVLAAVALITANAVVVALSWSSFSNLWSCAVLQHIACQPAHIDIAVRRLIGLAISVPIVVFFLWTAGRSGSSGGDTGK